MFQSEALRRLETELESATHLYHSAASMKIQERSATLIQVGVTFLLFVFILAECRLCTEARGTDGLLQH